jgi:hypothetical protein
MRKLLPCLLIAGLVAIAGCKKQAGGPGSVASDDPLTYVPADTPYVAANIDPVPVEFTNTWVEGLEKNGKYGDLIAGIIDDAAKSMRDAAARRDAECASSGGGGSLMQDASSGADASGGDAPADANAPQVAGMGDEKPADESANGGADCMQRKAATEKTLKLLDAIKAEFAGKDLKAVMDAFGASPQSHYAIYGIGLVPVARVELAKPDNLRATIARIETAAGMKMGAGKVGSQDYWYVDGSEWSPNHGKAAPLRLKLAIVGKQLVVTVAPEGVSDADLRILLGLDKPAKSLADSGDLAALNKRMGYTNFGSGYFDSAKLVAVLKAPATSLENSFLTAMGEKEKPKIDAVCAKEYDALAGAWPGANFGTTELRTKHVEVRGVLQARADIAKDLMGLSAPMPGMDAAKDSLGHLGFSIDLTKLPDMVGKYADATAKAPWQCPQLADLNKHMAQAKTNADNPMVVGYASKFHGLHAIVDKLEMKDDSPMPDIAAVAVIGSNDPSSLLAMAGSFAPDIANAGLKPDGVPKALPPLPNMPPNLPLSAAMTNQLLAISMGAGEDAKLTTAMKLDPAQQPMFVIGIKGEVYHLFAKQMRKTAQSMNDPAAQQMMEHQAKMQDMYAEWIKRAEIRVDLTDQGVELRETLDMN